MFLNNNNDFVNHFEKVGSCIIDDDDNISELYFK